MANLKLPEQCRLYHGPNGPLARAPKLLGAPPTDATNFFTLYFLKIYIHFRQQKE